MDLTTEDRRPSQDTARLTPRERLERFVALQRRAMQLLAASPDGLPSLGDDAGPFAENVDRNRKET